MQHFVAQHIEGLTVCYLGPLEPGRWAWKTASGKLWTWCGKTLCHGEREGGAGTWTPVDGVAAMWLDEAVKLTLCLDHDYAEGKPIPFAK